MLIYFQKSYIGDYWLKGRNKGTRKTPRFPIDTWNLYDRILKNLPRTNNSVECWHAVLTKDEKSHITVNKLIEKLRREQTQTETLLALINTGTVFKQRGDQIKYDQSIYNVVSGYDKADMNYYLKNIALVLSK